MWIVCITSVRHVLTVNGYGGRQTKENEKSWCFKGWETLVYYIINQEKSKPFLRASQALLNGRLLQSVTADCTVRYGGLYGSLQQTIQSIAEDCSNPTYRQA